MREDRGTARARPADLRAVDGRMPGRRGRATRERLLRCTEGLLERTSFRDLTVIDIARCAGTSPATFYQYFPDVEGAVLVLAGEMAEQAKALVALIRTADWRGGAGHEAALALVDGVLDLWERNRPVLRVVDLSVAEGDLRFQNMRTRLLNELTEELKTVVARFHQQGRHAPDIDPMAQAAALVSMLVHVAAHRYGFEFWGIRTDDIRRSVAGLVFTGLTGRRPPAP